LLERGLRGSRCGREGRSRRAAGAPARPRGADRNLGRQRMRVLVTGSSGHVGGAVASHLLSCGHEVVGLGRRLTGATRRLTGAVAVDLAQPGAAARIRETQPRCDAIVHAAAVIDPDPYAPAVSLTNCLGTQQIVELATGWEVSSLVYISSLPVIGRPQALPVTEDHPTAPPTAYHASKLYGEQLVALAPSLASASLRLTSAIGPGMPDGRILPVFVRRALTGQSLLVAGEGTRAQDYVDVRDVAMATAAALERGTPGLLNIASGRCVTNL